MPGVATRHPRLPRTKNLRETRETFFPPLTFVGDGGFPLSVSSLCTRCGFQNQPGYQFCTNCGAPLAAAPSAAVPPAAPYAAPPAYAAPAGYAPYPGSFDYERGKRVERTKTGVLLLLIGSLLTWVPVVSIFAYILILIGVILVILGRKAFGPAHSRNILLSIILFIVGIIVVVAVTVAYVLPGVISSIGPGGTVNLTPAFYASAANAGLLAGIVGAIIIGIAEVLFTYALQAPNGRILLWAAYGANLALSVVLWVILSPLFSAVVTQTDYDSAAAAQQTYALLSVIPALLFAVADYLAWARINRKEIPAPSPAPPVMPPMMPPAAPPMPPQAPPSGPAPPVNPP